MPHASLRTRAAAAFAACLALTASAAWSAVHTRLESSRPAAGEVVAAAPERIELRFSGPVNPELSSLVLVSPSGDSIPVRLDASPEDDRLLVGDVPALAAGDHLVRWRTVSADGHPLSGEFAFTVAPASSGSEPSAVEQAEDARGYLDPSGDAAGEGSGEGAGDLRQHAPGAGTVLLAGVGLICLLGFAGLLWFCGSLPLLEAARVRRAVLGLGWGALLLLAADLLRWCVVVVPPGAGAAGWAAALGSSSGIAAIVRLGLLGSALALLDRHGRGAAGLALAAVLAGAASGHPVAISPWIVMPANAIHLGAAALWLGGLLLLLLAPAGSPGDEREPDFGAVVRAVSGTALFAVVLIAGSGLVQSVQLVGGLSAFTDTDYGRGVLAKTGGLMVLIGFGAFHRFRTIPALAGEAGAGGLRRTVRAETIVMLAVVMLAAWLARVSPPAGY